MTAEPAPPPTAQTLPQLLARNRDFRLLWLGNLVSVSGSWFTAVAAFAMIYHHSGSGLAAGTMLALRYLPGLFGSAYGGVLADRFDRRTIMIVADLVLALLALGYLLADSQATLWLVYPLAFASAATGFVFQAARNAWMPTLVQPREYVLYSAAVQINGLLLQALGGMAGAAAVGLLGWRWAFVLNAVSFAASVYFTVRVTAGSRSGGGTEHTGALRSLADGLRVAYASRVIRALLAMEFVFCLGLGGLITAMTYLALQVFNLGDGGTGWFYGVQGVVGATTLLLAAPWLQRLTPRHQMTVLGLSCITEGITAAALGLPSLAWVALALWGTAALAEVVYNPLATATLVAHSGNAHRGRVMSLWMATATTALGLSAFASGYILDTYGHEILFLALGVLMALPGVAWLLALHRGALTPASDGQSHPQQ
ncbi:MFS transporter [Lipingzhangella sp. LS1_29]|uniref:MFS transporter n=1 Tax=Lipingzhangella rawalii TaxID=2055835 RepID=A0ABU2H5S7_9ACTN|nr:MFS transporter [Lipingzhangella rawalii]MDS1270653.1 MFS transporter [Lipingzhangella rawalii]